MGTKILQDKIVTIGGGRPTVRIEEDDTVTSGEIALAGSTMVKKRPVYVPGIITDISTAGSFFVAVPAGTISKIFVAIDHAITVADAGLSFEIDGTAVTGGGITIPYATAAAGSVYTAEPTAANVVGADGAIEMITDGASTTSCRATVTFEIIPTVA